ncbi:MAG: tail fiber domain-containing protein, partial [Cetobacterium sp.]|uniref:pyocin knob domain-containing S74 family peptidase n=1 Tax=Cetobacterium sp. TaxID=2071632 RepID=UPI003EE6BF83
MANLKSGTLIGGNMIWNAGNLPLTYSAGKIKVDTFRIYTENDKPTAAELGVVNKAGDTGIGDLSLTRGKTLTGTLTHSYGYLSVYPYGTSYGLDGASGNRCRFYYKEHENGKPDQKNRGLVFSSNDSDGTAHDLNIWLNNKKVYHEGFKPTASDVGAVNKAGDTMTGTLYNSGTDALNSGFTIGTSSKKLFNMSVGHNGQAMLYINEADDRTKNGLCVRTVSSSNTGSKDLFRIDSAGELYAKGNSKVYHVDNKPTIAEIGAAPSGFGLGEVSRSMPDANSIGNVGGFFGAGGDAGKNFYNKYAPLIQAFRAGGGDGTGQMLQIQEGDSTIAFRNRSNNNWSAWTKLYSTNFKPTAAEVGAVSKAGDTMTGALTVNTESGNASVMIDRNAYPNIRLHAKNNPADKRFKFIEMSTDGSLSIITRNEAAANNGVVTIAAGKSGEVYHTGNKPTATELNVPNAYIRDVTSQDWDTLTDPGSYRINNANGVNFPAIVGLPKVYNYGNLFVQNTGGVITQVYILDGSSFVYTRTKWLSNAWKPWSTSGNAGSININSSVDLNDYSYGGTYNMYKGSGVTFTNAPSDFDYGTLQVIGQGRAASSFCTQILTYRNTGRQKVRARNDGAMAWTNWVDVYSSAQKPTAADLNVVSNDRLVGDSSSWADIVNKIPYVHPNGVLTIGKYIDFHDTNSTNDYDVRLNANGSAGSQSLAVQTVNGTIEIGAKNTSYAHIYTDRPSFYFNKGINVLGNPTFDTATMTIKQNGRKHIRFEDTDVDGYIWKDPGTAWHFNHGNKASSDMQWTQNGELIIDGARWAASHAHGYSSQMGLKAPVHVAFGAVAGGSDYYPIVRGVSQASGHGYTTQVDLGCLRSGGNDWGQGILRVCSDESSSHPSAIYSFGINGDFYCPGSGNFNDVYIRSDERLKRNVTEVTGSLDAILNLKAVSYEKRKDLESEYEMVETGFIAQEVEKYLPDAVGIDGNGLKHLKPYAI